MLEGDRTYIGYELVGVDDLGDGEDVEARSSSVWEDCGCDARAVGASKLKTE